MKLNEGQRADLKRQQKERAVYLQGMKINLTAEFSIATREVGRK